VTIMMEWFAHPAFLFGAVLERMPLPHMLRLRDALRRLDQTVHTLIAARRNGAGQDDLLGALLGARDDHGAPMPDRQVRDEVFTLFLGGYEPSAVALGWLFYLLGRHPKVMARAVDEARAVVGDRVPTRDDLPKLAYLGQVLNESLRLYPPAWSIAREADEPCEIRGHKIPSGGFLWCSQWVLHRDPRWFEAPLEFRPDRWAGSLAKQLPRCAYLPYGGGPRVCVGAMLAQSQVLSLAALFLSRFRLELEPERRPRPLPSINLRPHGGVWARLAT
jgi:cytochrome P450